MNSRSWWFRNWFEVEKNLWLIDVQITTFVKLKSWFKSGSRDIRTGRIGREGLGKTHKMFWLLPRLVVFPTWLNPRGRWRPKRLGFEFDEVFCIRTFSNFPIWVDFQAWEPQKTLKYGKLTQNFNLKSLVQISLSKISLKISKYRSSYCNQIVLKFW